MRYASFRNSLTFFGSRGGVCGILVSVAISLRFSRSNSLTEGVRSVIFIQVVKRESVVGCQQQKGNVNVTDLKRSRRAPRSWRALIPFWDICTLLLYYLLQVHKN